MKNVFVHTANVKNFISAMRDADKVSGEPVLLAFWGQAGRGKTSAARFFAAQEGWTYVRALKGWTELWMLQDICFELMIDPVPHRKKLAFEAIKMKLYREPRPILIDEADKLSEGLLEWIRDLADITFVPFALIGERLVVRKMQKERRAWSRTLRSVEFGPIQAQDILFFAKQAAGLSLSANQAEILREASDGDFRLVSRDVRTLEELAEVNKASKISDDMVKLAIKRGLRGK
ncbi:MAG: ATP-binding protein [Deltaproteobacteria bacterium]|nr:ATP-binding protein [Deltaproteobacteria bacterium]MBW2081659.1 ATP-binding protein [Deltaproteobacteria bacterium]MBW2298854.1 ATP-binding protein [Deltaproteobacteria bacterium]